MITRHGLEDIMAAVDARDPLRLHAALDRQIWAASMTTGAMGELIETLGRFGHALLANPDVNVPKTITNLIRGITAQVRVGIVVATREEED